MNSVSYTHLDVYKRQAADSWVRPADDVAFIGLWLSRARKDALASSVRLGVPASRVLVLWRSCRRCFRRWRVAVSYTHLDVYKRQE